MRARTRCRGCRASRRSRVRRVGIFGEVLERHRAILDEGDGFSLLLHGHHDVEAGGAHLVDGGLQLRIEHLDDAAPFRSALVPAEAKIADELAQAQQPAKALAVILCANSTNRMASGRRARTVDGRAGTWQYRARARAWCGRSARPQSGRASRCAGRHPSPAKNRRNGRRRRRGGRGGAQSFSSIWVEKASVPSDPPGCARD